MASKKIKDICVVMEHVRYGLLKQHTCSDVVSLHSTPEAALEEVAALSANAGKNVTYDWVPVALDVQVGSA